MSSQSPNISPHGSYREFYPRKSEAFSYKPGEFIKHPFEPTFLSQSPSFISEPNIFKTSIVGNTSTHADQFYKSQVIERGIGGEPVYLNAINNYQPGSGADDQFVMDQIRQEHIRIMDNKLDEAVSINGRNSYQQVKTVILQPLTDVVELKVSTVQEGYPGTARKSNMMSTSGLISNPSGRVSMVSMSPLLNPRTSQVQAHSRVQYVPYERKVTELQTREIHQKVPVEKTIIEYEDRVRIEQVPVQKSVIDYYAVEHVTNYEPQIIKEKVTEMVPIQRTIQTTNYIPVEQKIVHYRGDNPALRGSVVKIEQPLTTRIESHSPLRGSFITYQSPPVGRSNSVLSRNSKVSTNKRLTRNSSELMNLASITSLSNNIHRPVSPLRHQVHRNNIHNKGFEYTRVVEQPVTYVHNAHVLPFTNQLHQMKVVHQEPIHRTDNIRHAQPPIRTVYPSPSQVQTIYQLSPNPYAPLSYSRPQEAVYEQNTLRRNLSGGIFMNR